MIYARTNVKISKAASGWNPTRPLTTYPVAKGQGTMADSNLFEMTREVNAAPYRTTTAKNMAGKTIGRLVVLHRTKTTGGKIWWMCKCSCGNKRIFRGDRLRGGRIKSCGCVPHDKLDGTQDSLEYHSWCSMRGRCHNPNNKRFARYGGRGITICERWKSFEIFLIDMGPRPSRLHTLDRKDNDGPYSPENCRWATRADQANNTSKNRRITHNGKTHTVAEWSRIVNLKESTLLRRLKHEWSAEEALGFSINPLRRKLPSSKMEPTP